MLMILICWFTEGEAYTKNIEVALAFQCCSITACASLEDDSY